MDYLSMHGTLIKEASYIMGPFSIPSNVDELANLLPGNTQFENIDDLLITIGKQHDRSLLHQFASKIFKVPHRVLVDAETNQTALIPKSVLAAVNESRRQAMDAGQAAASARGMTSYENDDEDEDDHVDWPSPSVPLVNEMTNVDDGTEEYADSEQLCDYCLPVFGDQIVGTRPESSPDAMATVHRIGCPHAQRAINYALSESRRPSPALFDLGDMGQPRVDSVTLRRTVRSRLSNSKASVSTAVQLPVKLRWSDEERTNFLCEVVVHAQDRKLLLADCSEIVSELSEIVKTGSQTTNEHATLVFLVYVRNLEHLQKLMDTLSSIRSVMAVERRVSFSPALIVCMQPFPSSPVSC
jgi:(p)ppGpp synthase/HD superfamily hydrolase